MFCQTTLGCPKSFINPLSSAGGAVSDPGSRGLCGSSSLEQGHPVRASHRGSLVGPGGDLLLLGSCCCWLSCPSCSVPSGPVPCSSTWSSPAGQGAALGWGFQAHQCPLKSSLFYFHPSPCCATGQSCVQAPSHQQLLGAPRAALGAWVLQRLTSCPSASRVPSGRGSYGWTVQLAGTGVSSWPKTAFVPQRATEPPEIAHRTGKIIKLLPSLPKASVFKQPKARGFSTRGLRCRALGLPTLWGQQEQSCVPSGWNSLWESRTVSGLREPGLAQGLVQVLVRHQSCCPLEPFSRLSLLEHPGPCHAQQLRHRESPVQSDLCHLVRKVAAALGAGLRRKSPSRDGLQRRPELCLEQRVLRAAAACAATA